MITALLTVAWAMIFRKAGERWWKVLIPFYGLYTGFRISGRRRWFPVMLVCGAVFLLFFAAFLFCFGIVTGFMAIGAYAGGMTWDEFLGGSTAAGLLAFGWMLALSILGLCGLLAAFAVRSFAICRRFGRTKFFSVLAAVFPVILLPVVAFGADRYDSPV